MIVALTLSMVGVACGSLFGASVMVTVMMDKGQYLVGKYGSPVGITVIRGSGYLALTWTATLMAFAGVVAASSECCRRRNREAIMVFFGK